MTTDYETFLIFDTETGGFPSKKLALTDPGQPPTVQIGAILCNRERVLGELNMILTVGDRKINPFAAEVHGMDEAFCNKYGVEPAQALLAFNALVQKADVLVCHNFAFDVQMINMMYATLAPKDAHKAFATMPYFCTMEATTEFCKLPKARGHGYKWPKLEELHRILFEEDFEGAHDAMADVKATVRCFMDERVFPFA